MEGGAGGVAAGRAAEANAGAVGTGHHGAQLGKAGAAVGAHLVRIEDGGEGLLHEEGVPGLNGLGGDDVATHVGAVLHVEQGAHLLDGLVSAQLQLWQGDLWIID